MRLIVPVIERDHIQGPATAAVTLVQYGDYECPYTHQSTTVVRAIQQQLGDQLRLVFRNFPLTTIHPHALHAALAERQQGNTKGVPTPMRMNRDNLISSLNSLSNSRQDAFLITQVLKALDEKYRLSEKVDFLDLQNLLPCFRKEAASQGGRRDEEARKTTAIEGWYHYA